MLEDRSKLVDLARDTYLRLSGGVLTPSVAKLYSQYTRVSAGRPGLAFWRDDEAEERLADAAQLIDAAFLKKTAADGDWQVGLRRAGEILEWLSHPEFDLRAAPIRLLGAAAYQLAGYPAMAGSLLERVPPTAFETRLLPPTTQSGLQGIT